MKKQIKKLFLPMVIVGIFTLASPKSFAGMQLGLDGSQSKAHMGLVTKESAAMSLSLSLDLGSYFRVSYKHQQQQENARGYTRDPALPNDDKAYVRYSSKSYITANALNLIVILYAGEVFMPYIFGGVVFKNYDIETTIGDKTEKDQFSFPSPNGGAAMVFRFSQKFSFKVTYTMSQGVYQASPDIPQEKAEKPIDGVTEVGIQYAIY